MTTLTATDARKELFTMLWNVSKGSLYKIKYKNDNIVLLPEWEYEELIETLELLSEKWFKSKLIKAEKEITKWQVFDFDEVFD